MRHFLFVFDRAAGVALRVEQYSNGTTAMHARFAAEHAYPGMEVVVISADNLDTIRQTHGRYFDGVTLERAILKHTP